MSGGRKVLKIDRVGVKPRRHRSDIGVRRRVDHDTAPRRPDVPQPSRSDDLRRGDLDAEAFKADIMLLARGDEFDRRNAEIAEDLRAEADLAPFAFAPQGLLVGLVAMGGPRAGPLADADRPLAQIDDDAALVLAHAAHDLVEPAVGS